MDLLFVRYASPFVLLDSLILTHSLNNFISDFIDFVNKDKEWEFFLHKIYDQTWDEFSDSIKLSNKTNGLAYRLNSKSINLFNPIWLTLMHAWKNP